MKKFLLFALAFCIANVTLAHTVNYQLDKMDDGDVFLRYLVTGFQHIIPYGLDHILFILCVFFLNKDLKQIILQASMFTLAHSITLGLAIYGVINPPSHLVEPLIAASILLLAIENIYFTKVQPWRMAMVFLFGLVHGMGFAGALSELGLPKYAFATGLLGFNIGVELGQISIILFMYFAVSRLFSKKIWYRKWLVMPASALIALVAAYWTIERIFFS